MINKIKVVVISIMVLFAILLVYKLLFIRTVNYEIAGVKIPSHYNVLSGTVTPIINYKGKRVLPEIRPSQNKNVGLTKEEVAMAQFRWALFEQWVRTKPEYKGWESNEAIFKKAHEVFRKEIGSKAKLVVMQ